jgi:3-hydroxyacyl-CoA dehydrogenase
MGYNGIMGCEIAAIAAMAIYAVGVRWENARRDKKEQGVLEVSTETMLDDLTDKEKPGFRYVC